MRLRKKPSLLVGLICLGVLGAGCDVANQAECDEPYVCGTCPQSQDCALPGTAMAFQVLSKRAGFFAKPWPADTRLSPDGSPDLADFPNPANASMLTSYLETVAAETRGWGLNAAIFFTFDGAIDPAGLPTTPLQSQAEGASVFLIDVSDGPGRGERFPLAIRFFDHQRQFTPENTLVLRPVLGFPLRQNTRYAAVVDRALSGQDGRPLGASADFERTKYEAEPDNEDLRAWWQSHRPVWDDLEELTGLDRSQVAALTVFTTQDVHSEMEAVAAYVDAQPAPVPSGWNTLADKPDIHRVEAWYETPEFQAGNPPDFDGGGGFVFNQAGVPVPQRVVEIPFTLAVPKGAMPSGGWPIVLYSHGTGGSRNGFASGTDDVADKLARRGLASMGIDQPLHGDRNPWGRNEDIITFNPNNILAMRDNFRQGAADLLVQRKLVGALEVPAGESPTGQAIRFDDSKVAFMGHSQGSLNGPIFMSVSGNTLGAVFSGSGGGLGPAILGKTAPVDIPALIILAMGLEASEFDMDHPVVAIFQIFAERADPLNYSRRLIAEPPGGASPKHLFFSQGLLDEYALPDQTAAMAAASGCWPMQPLIEDLEPFVLCDREALPGPLSGNATGPDGQAITAVMAQYPDDGHFAVFYNEDAQRHYLGFLESLLSQDLPVVGP
jgi:hypothetical protein